MDQISCNVCMDLMPLVKDGIASEDSYALVMKHIEGCEHCADTFGRKKLESSEMKDDVVLTKLKKQLTVLLIGVIFVGILIGMVLSDGMGMFYNALIMPAIGGFGYMILQKKSCFFPLGLFLFSFLWVGVREIVKGFLTYSTLANLFMMSAWWAGIWALFSAVGVLIAGLLHYAFKKEG